MFFFFRRSYHTEKMLDEVDAVEPCGGIRKDQYARGHDPEGFDSVVRHALRHGKPTCGRTGMGHFPGFNGTGTSATLHAVGDDHVFRHAGCSGIARQRGTPSRCGTCTTYLARTLLPKFKSAASAEYSLFTNHANLGSTQKVCTYRRTICFCVGRPSLLPAAMRHNDRFKPRFYNKYPPTPIE